MVDLIDRGKLIAELQWLKEQEYEAVGDMWDDIIERVRKQPRVAAELVRHGHWIESPNIMECVVCSSCLSDDLSAQVVAPAPKWYRYCSCCGAKMDEEDNENG